LRHRSELRINAKLAIATIAIYRIGKSLVLVVFIVAERPVKAHRDAMSTQVMFERPIADVLRADPGADRNVRPADVPNTSRPQIELSLHDDLASIESDWRSFEEHADCTAFQTFDWLSTWFRNIGVREGVQPAVVIGRHEGTILFLLPFALEVNSLDRKVTWLGSYLCNYNGPVLARDFSRRLSPAQFPQVWRDVEKLLRDQLRHDLVDLEKMPETIGEQPNPFCSLHVTAHVNDAYLTTFTGDWETYYAEKRSAATRKTDRRKRKRLADHGETRFIPAASRDDLVRSIDALIDEKRVSYAKLGVANMFAWPGYRDFFIEMATGPRSSRLTYVSRLDVGPMTAAANFGLIFRGRYYYILAGYDDGELARFGPGYIQLQDVMRDALERGCKIFDFTIGDEPYKRDWCDTEIRLCDYVSPVSLRGWTVAVPTVVFRYLKRSIKRNAIVWALVRKVRTLMGLLRR
jgi:CelD/BcsL family acetyltransferase involved in cellulose biosynthesis